MEIMGILYFLFLCINAVSGFHVQTGSTGISNSQTNDDRTVQNLLNLIVNERNSRLLQQNIVTTLTNKFDQLEKAQEHMQKTTDVKINQTENETVKKLNEMSARLAQLEQFNADVSRQLGKEKNNREHLEEMYTALEKRVKILTTMNVKQSEIRRIETTLNNLTNVDKKHVNLTHHYEGTQTQIKALDLKLHNMTHSNNSMQDKLVGIEAKLSNINADENNTHNRLANISKEIGPLKQLIENMTTAGQPKYHKSVGFSVIVPDPSSESGSHDPLKYQTLIDNTGRNYNLSTGVFTCQYPGLYFFTATIFRSWKTNESYCYFYVNNQRLSIVSGGTESQERNTSGTQSMVYLLTVGDRVYLSSCGGVDHMNSYSSFSGFLISN